MREKFICSVPFLRGILLLLNILFVLVGITILVLGIYIKIDSNISAILDKLDDVSDFEGKSLGFLAFVMIGGGIFTMIVAFTGCMGSLWHNKCTLYVYSIVLGLLMILELGGVITAFAYRSRLENVYRDNLLTVLTTALNKGDSKVLDAFSDLEKRLKCCGVTGIKDYHGKEPKNPDCYRYRTGCSSAIIKLFDQNLPIIGTTLGLVLFFELLCLIAGIALAVALKSGFTNSGTASYSPSNPKDLVLNVVPNRRNTYKRFN